MKNFSIEARKIPQTSSHLYAYTAVSQPSSSEQDPLHKSGKSTQEAYIKVQAHLKDAQGKVHKYSMLGW